MDCRVALPIVPKGRSQFVQAVIVAVAIEPAFFAGQFQCLPGIPLVVKQPGEFRIYPPEYLPMCRGRVSLPNDHGLCVAGDGPRRVVLVAVNPGKLVVGFHPFFQRPVLLVVFQHHLHHAVVCMGLVEFVLRLVLQQCEFHALPLGGVAHVGGFRHQYPFGFLGQGVHECLSLEYFGADFLLPLAGGLEN